MIIARRRLAPSSSGCVLLALGLLLLSAPVYAQDQAFKDGMKAYDDKKWAEAAKLMRQAIQASPEDANRKVEYGGVLGVARKNTTYLPNFYLGHALYMMQPQDCAGAINAWAASERQGAVLARREFSTIILGGYAECEKKGVLPPKVFDPIFSRTQQQYNEANNLARTVLTIGEQNLEQWRPAEIREGYERAAADLKLAYTRVNTGARTRAEKDLNEASAAIERARVQLLRIESALNSSIDAARSARNLARDVEQALSAADADDRQIDARMAGRTALTPALSAMRQQGKDALSRGHTLYGTGSKSSNTAQLTDARTFARDASAKFKQVADEMTRLDRLTSDRQLSDARTSAAQAGRLLEELFTTIDRRMAANPTLAAQIAADYETVRTQADSARRRLETASKGDNLAAIQQATRTSSAVRDRLSALTTRFGPLTIRERGVSQALEEGAGRYLAGRYEEALQLLNPAGGIAADDPMRLHVHLFRAASLHALYLKSGERKADLRAQALAEIEQCRTLESTFQPDRRYFSPAFIAFFEAGGTQNGQAVATNRP